ncbi:MAG: HRDC domain-containing protein, partial [Myxococcales bacterium]|nr:HRDC domain-containing protein [Myxococcales bacterium]
PVLRGELAVELRRDVKARAAAKRPKRQRRASETDLDDRRAGRRAAMQASDGDSELSEADQILYDALRARRREIAQRAGVPPYVVFHDRTLQELARLRPRTEEQLLTVHGIGQAKLERFGAEFLELLRSDG